MNGRELLERQLLRAAILSSPRARQLADGVVAAMQLELAELDDDAPAPEWIPPDPRTGRVLTVGAVRARVRVLLEDLAAAELAP